MVKELNSGLSAKQATNTASFLRAQNKDVLTKSTKAQAATTARVAVNFPGQWRWLEVRGFVLRLLYPAPYTLQLHSSPYPLQSPVKFCISLFLTLSLSLSLSIFAILSARTTEILLIGAL
jgi:hypothetical protein